MATDFFFATDFETWPSDYYLRSDSDHGDSWIRMAGLPFYAHFFLFDDITVIICIVIQRTMIDIHVHIVCSGVCLTAQQRSRAWGRGEVTVLVMPSSCRLLDSCSPFFLFYQVIHIRVQKRVKNVQPTWRLCYLLHFWCCQHCRLVVWSADRKMWTLLATTWRKRLRSPCKRWTPGPIRSIQTCFCKSSRLQHR